MSRTKPVTTSSNPSVATFEWSASSGVFTAWHSAKKQKIEIGNNFSFAPLDQLCVIGGYLKDKGTARTRELHHLNKPIEVLLWKDGKSSVYASGMYADIKGDLKSQGIKFRKIIYATLLDDLEEFSFGDTIKLDLGGAAMSEWIESKILLTDGVKIGEPEMVEVNKMIKFWKPKFNVFELSDNESQLANEADEVLQDYFNGEYKKDEPSKNVELEEIPF